MVTIKLGNALQTVTLRELAIFPQFGCLQDFLRVFFAAFFFFSSSSSKPEKSFGFSPERGAGPYLQTVTCREISVHRSVQRKRSLQLV